MHVQAEGSDEAEATARDNNDTIIRSQQCKSIPDSYNNVNGCDVSHAENIGEIRELSDEKSSSVCDDNDATTSDDGGRIIDVSITDPYVVNSDIPPVVASTADSEINHIQDADAASSNAEPDHDMAEQDPESNEMATGDSPRVLVEGASEPFPPAQSTCSTEANRNDQPSRPDTILSWSDSPHSGTSSSNKCAVQFENSVIFDLDVE